VRFVRWIVALPFAIAVIVFAVANRGSVEVSFDPLPFSPPVPLYAIVFGAAIAGFLAGAAVVWFGGLRWRSLARNRGNRADFLERELNRLNQPADRAEGREPGVPNRLPTVADAR
jgi:uncharacterized integral membrane protein